MNFQEELNKAIMEITENIEKTLRETVVGIGVPEEIAGDAEKCKDYFRMCDVYSTRSKYQGQSTEVYQIHQDDELLAYFHVAWVDNYFTISKPTILRKISLDKQNIKCYH